MSQLNFQIDGEFLTNIARNWFWKENKDYEKSEELLCSCMPKDADVSLKKNIARDIMEYRKKFVGINEFELVDDTENDEKRIEEKIKQIQFDNLVKAIELRILTADALHFVDPHSTTKNIDTFIDSTDNPNDIREIVEYFMTDDGADSPTKDGLWLFDEPKLIAKIFTELKSETTDDAFWNCIYKYTKYREGFKERNNRYLAFLRTQNVDTEPYETAIDPLQRYIQNTLEPDNIKSFTGLCSPDGEFYSCEFGEHEWLAEMLCYKYPELRQELTKQHTIIGNCLDILIENNWIALRFLYGMGKFLSYKDSIKPSRKQTDKIWDAIVKFDVKNIELPEFMIY